MSKRITFSIFNGVKIILILYIRQIVDAAGERIEGKNAAAHV
jgi:hypothetical protein